MEVYDEPGVISEVIEDMSLETVFNETHVDIKIPSHCNNLRKLAFKIGAFY